MDPLPDPIVVVLAARRRSLNLSQAVIAARVGATRAHLNRIETGRAAPTLPLTRRYADAVGIDLHASERDA